MISIEREGLTIDLKLALYPKEKLAAEFAKDVVGFANTSGGCLVLGMDEEGGIASSMPGVDVPDPDALFRQMQQSLAANTDPVPFVRFAVIDLANKKKVVLVGVPQSRSLPHAVRGENSLTFYKRTDAATCERMTVAEIRKAVQQSQSVEEQCRDHHLKTCAILRSQSNGIHIYLSLFPLPLGHERIDFGSSDVRHHALQIRNVIEVRGNQRLTFAGHSNSLTDLRMSQLIDRRGVFSEASYHIDRKDMRMIAPGWLLCRLAATIDSVFEFYKQVGINESVIAIASVRGCQGRHLHLANDQISNSITEDSLDFPTIIFEESPNSAIASLHSWGLRLYQAADMPTCPLYEWPSGKIIESALEPYRSILK